MDRRLYWIWLAQALPIGSGVVNKLLDAFPDIETIYTADKGAYLTAGISPKQLDGLCNKSLDTARKILMDVQALGGWVLTPDDAAYPMLLRQIDGTPAVLYGVGSMPNMNKIPALTMVGTRYPTEEGAQNAFVMAGAVAAAGVVIVSGGAVGIDRAAHEGALAVGGKTVLVKAAPLEVEYPPKNTTLRRQILENGGAIVTEFAPHTPYRCDFHVRNRLMAGMTMATCLGETPKASGALITANLAREQGRDVFAIPAGVANSKNLGAHEQIRKGALLVANVDHILQEYAVRYAGLLDVEAAHQAEKTLRAHVLRKTEMPQEAIPTLRVADEMQTPPPEAASKDAKGLFTLLTRRPMPIDDIAAKAGMTIPEILVLLTELELLGAVQCTAGQQYCKT